MIVSFVVKLLYGLEDFVDGLASWDATFFGSQGLIIRMWLFQLDLIEIVGGGVMIGE